MIDVITGDEGFYIINFTTKEKYMTLYSVSLTALCGKFQKTACQIYDITIHQNFPENLYMNMYKVVMLINEKCRIQVSMFDGLFQEFDDLLAEAWDKKTRYNSAVVAPINIINTISPNTAGSIPKTNPYNSAPIDSCLLKKGLGSASARSPLERTRQILCKLESAKKKAKPSAAVKAGSAELNFMFDCDEADKKKNPETRDDYVDELLQAAEETGGAEDSENSENSEDSEASEDSENSESYLDQQILKLTQELEAVREQEPLEIPSSPRALYTKKSPFF